MSRLRPAAVSGLFYPDSASALRSAVRGHLDEAGSRLEPTGDFHALVAPHAGYAYSGPIAGSSFCGLGRGRTFERVALLGPSHHYAFEGLALPDADALATPLGAVPIDHELVEKIEDLPQVCVLNAAHKREHSLEVELPFLQEALGEVPVLPLVVGLTTPEAVAEVLARIWSNDTLVVISTDLSHFLSYDDAVRVDDSTAKRILELDTTIPTDRACGAMPLSGFLLEAARRGLTGRLLDLRNSGDTAGGHDSVVGYSAFEFASK